MEEDFPYNSVWDYLEEKGVMEKDEFAIKAAKKAYKKLYDRFQKRRQRGRRPEINISFENEHELNELRLSATKHHKPLSVFIRESAKAYTLKNYVQPNQEHYERILQSLKLIELKISMAEEKESGNNLSYTYLLEILVELSEDIKRVLNDPLILEKAIEQTIQFEPWRREVLINFIHKI